MIGIIDYNAGNLTSVCNTLDEMKVEYFVSADVKVLEKTQRILFPGVGHAKSAMQELEKRGLDVFLKNTQKPVLGICVGMQLLFDFSEEGETECLGIIPGKVKKFKPFEVGIIPHMGWNEISKIDIQNTIFSEVEDYSDFYFVHSYYCAPEKKEHVVAMTDYGQKSFCCIVQKDNFLGMQFHPEKSSNRGKKILENFCSGPRSHLRGEGVL